MSFLATSIKKCNINFRIELKKTFYRAVDGIFFHPDGKKRNLEIYSELQL